MIELLSIIDSLSRALQRKDQDIVEAMHLIIGVKDNLQDTPSSSILEVV
jgi:molecular chaperone GrpE (heat shock protein)